MLVEFVLVGDRVYLQNEKVWKVEHYKFSSQGVCNFVYRHGAQERVFRLEFISNQDFTDSEFMKWRETCALQGISMPTHDELEQKLKDIKEAMIYEFKEEDIEKVGIIIIFFLLHFTFMCIVFFPEFLLNFCRRSSFTLDGILPNLLFLSSSLPFSSIFSFQLQV
jgi:hypothetical protein